MPKRNLAWVAVIALIAAASWKLPEMVARVETVNRSFDPLIAARNEIYKHYVEPADDDTLVTGAIKGMLWELDPHSAYISPEDLDEFRKHSKGEFGGVGIEIDPTPSGLIVISPIEDTPAYHAGILAGDRILAIDGVSAEPPMVVTEAMQRIMGQPGTTVNLTVFHPSHSVPRTIPVRRAMIKIASVKGWYRPDGGDWMCFLDEEERIAYLRITSFVGATPEELKRMIQSLQEQRMRGLVLDLRDNGGGLLGSAIEVADLFLSDGTIVTTRRYGDPSKDGDGEPLEEWTATAEGTLSSFPMVVLTNHVSASASEIVAGALRDHDRAVLVGERTFGKGSVQNVYPLPPPQQEAHIKLTVAYYYLPDGECIHRTKKSVEDGSWGVGPDEEVVLSEKELIHMRNDRVRGGVVRAPTTAPADDDSAEEPSEQPAPATRPVMPQPDRQTARALEILREKLAPPTTKPVSSSDR